MQFEELSSKRRTLMRAHLRFRVENDILDTRAIILPYNREEGNTTAFSHSAPLYFFRR